MNMVHVSVGLTPELEGGLVWGSDSGFSFTTLNLALRLPAPKDFSAIAGVVNLFSDEYFRSDKPSPYLMACKRLVLGQQKEGKPPTVVQPFVAWGSQSHRGWFGGVAADLSPQTRVTLANYPDPWGAHQILLGISHSLPADNPRWALGLGTWGGNPYLAVSTPGGWVPWPRYP